MAIVSRLSIIMALGLMIPPGTASAATQEHIGNWVLTCPGDAPRPGPCLLQLERRFLDKAGIIAGLEVQALGNILVPVITLRGLSSELLIAASLAGKTEASMQFGGSPREDLACTPSSLGYICAPRDGAAQRLAARLPWARLVTVRVSVAPAGMKPLPAQEKSLDLSGTSGALARLRTAGPAQVPDPLTALSSQTPATFMEMADKALKAAGYPNGMANLQGLLAKYREK